MRFAVALLMALVTAACASWEKSETVVTEIGRVPVSEAIGLSRSELEKRLGLAPVEEPLLASAWIEDGLLMQRVTMHQMRLQQRCPSGRMPDLGFTRVGKTWGMPSLIYRDGRLSAFGDEPRQGDDPAEPAFLTATCTSYHRAGRDAAKDVVAIAVYAPVLLPAGALIASINAVGLIGAPDINVGLAQLPLGAAPPGRLDAYLAKLPPGARLKSRDANTARVEFCRRKCEDVSVDRAAGVTFVNGLVARLDGGRCALTAARAFRCAE